MTETPTAADRRIDEARKVLTSPAGSYRYTDIRRAQAVLLEQLEELRRGTDAAVAAELRRIADHFETQTVPGTVLPEPRTLHMVVTRLRARADELDPPAGVAVQAD